MSRANYFKIIPIILIGIYFTFLNGCSKDESNPQAPQASVNTTPPSLPLANFTLPKTNSNDPVISLITGYIESVNALKTYSDAIKDLQATRDSDTWIWNYVKGSLTITLTATPQPDGNCLWNVTVSGTKDNETYLNWLSAEGIASADGKSGTWKIFKDKTSILEGEYTWDQLQDGTITGTAKAFKDGNETGRINLVNHPDKSGQVEVFVLNNIFFKATWLPDGSGSWWRYGFNGAVINQGNWK